MSAVSCVVATTALASIADDGVRTFVMVKLCCVCCAMLALAIVAASVRVAESNDAVAVGAPVAGVVNNIAGVSNAHGF